LIAEIIGIAILLTGASGVFAEPQDALNTIWGVKPKEEGLKGVFKVRFTSYTMVLGIAFLLLVSLIISSIVAAMSSGLAAYLPGGAAVAHLLENSASFAVVTLLFAMIFKVLPDVKIRWRDVWVGTAFTALLFTVGKFAIGMYIGKSGIGTAYGAAGSIVVPGYMGVLFRTNPAFRSRIHRGMDNSPRSRRQNRGKRRISQAERSRRSGAHSET
jgi:membrane protein